LPGKTGTTPYSPCEKIGSRPGFSSIFPGLGGIGIDGPDLCMLRSFPIDIISPQFNLQPPGDEEFESIVGFV
jgi:hypothetical protein